MAAPPAPTPEQSAARAPLSPSELADACKIEVYDIEGKTRTLGDLIHGQRSVLVFTRHFCKFARCCENDVSNMRRVSKLPSLCTGY